MASSTEEIKKKVEEAKAKKVALALLKQKLDAAQILLKQRQEEAERAIKNEGEKEDHVVQTSASKNRADEKHRQINAAKDEAEAAKKDAEEAFNSVSDSPVATDDEKKIAREQAERTRLQFESLERDCAREKRHHEALCQAEEWVEKHHKQIREELEQARGSVVRAQAEVDRLSKEHTEADVAMVRAHQELQSHHPTLVTLALAEGAGAIGGLGLEQDMHERVLGEARRRL